MLAYILSIFLSFVPALVIFFAKRGKSAYVSFHAMQALLIWVAAGFLIACLVALNLSRGAPVILMVTFLVLLVGAAKATGGEEFEMPLVGRFVRQVAGL